MRHKILTSSALTLGPEIGLLGYIIEIHIKKQNNEHVKQECCETSWKSLRKWLKTWIIIYFRTQNNQEIGPLRLIFNKPLKVAQIDK